MRIADVLRRKGSGVVTITPDDTVRALLDRLAEHRVGALVVSADGSAVDGIVSERDVVRALPGAGAALLEQPVSSVMTEAVRTCPSTASVEDLMATMTDHRVRHVPVVDDGRLVGIVSIGDVVKNRIDELRAERDQLEAYVRG